MNINQKLEYFKNKGYKVIDGTLYSHKNKIIKGRATTKLNGHTLQINIELLKHFLLTNEVINIKRGRKLKDKPYKEKKKLGRPKKSESTIIKKEKKLKTPKKIVIVEKPKKIKYLDSIDLTKEIIISQGKGTLTKKAELMLVKIADNLIRKFTYYNQDDQYDCKMSGLISMFENWKSFNHQLYNNAFPYFTEICKRGIVKGLDTINGINRYHNRYHGIKKAISLSSFKNNF